MRTQKRLIALCILLLGASAVFAMAQGREPVNIPPGMVFIEGGQFSMGSGAGKDEEMPVHVVTLSSFFIDTTEVTVLEYRRFCSETVRRMPQTPVWGWSDTAPIVNVSWADADAYARWAGKRLPTEAEWEYAAQGGKKREGFPYAGSNVNSEVAWCSDNSESRTHPVGTRKPNILGLYDMSGNVWEWCSDWYAADYYKVSPNSDPKGPTTGEYRIVRGGSWNCFDDFCRLAIRGQFHPNTKVSSCGFRCARDVN